MALLQPPRSSYTKASKKVWFSYVEGSNKFQHDLLGITNSYIAGNLHLQFPEEEPLNAKQIEVSITGTEYVHWTEQVIRTCQVYNASTNSFYTHTYVETIHYIHEKQILNRSLTLWQSSNLKNNVRSKKELYEKITNMHIPFQISLPNDLPPSMSLDTGNIYYNVNAKIKRKMKFWKCQGSKKKIKCICNITRYSPMPITDPFRWVEWDDQKAWKRGLEIFVGLKEYHIFRASGNVKSIKKYAEERSVSGDQFPNILNTHNEWSHNFRIEVLNDKVNWTTDRYNINVHHKIKIKIKFGFFSGKKNINLERMVNIENILEES
ncbi:unnamed protein product [Rhizophagus irregularis]|uniref:Arrestin-like N-terminal domain-containing protein n=1 Tax=Rhizophagus irregularis TaxID=588596 RepID=A0A2N1MXD7_9GLOM|nr:hypothetical protein RhiirC2_714933 [Rhizophagus irregularis]CAB4393028.1 unnamed protein product [Rhizophagus irregularis]CAB5377799.1 unnamed protein product [Rhizophagus irregularis]